MKAKTATPKKPRGQFPYITPEEFKQGMADYWAKFHRLSKAKQRARLIEMGALTPEGKVPVYPMDHVPLGPRHKLSFSLKHPYPMPPGGKPIGIQALAH